MKKRAAAALLTLSMAFANISGFAYQKDFKDVNSTDWYYQTVTNMTNQGLINGYEDGTFRPQQQISRIEYAKIIFAALPMNAPLIDVSEEIKNEFRKEHTDYWGTETIIEAVERSLGGRFGVTVEEWSKPITRAEMAYITYGACATSDYDSQLSFYQDMGDTIGDYGDCLASDYCVSVLVMFSSGILAGVNDNRDFAPEQNASRAEACAVINRVLDTNARLAVGEMSQIKHSDAPHFNDYISKSFSYLEPKVYDTPPVDYGYLESVKKGDLTSGKYGPMTKAEADEVQKVVDEFIRNYTNPNMSDLRKACVAAEYIMHNCSYGSDDAPKAYTAWGALVGHAAWCTGFSYAYKLLCDSMGIGCVAVPANSEAANPSHMWNMVEIDGYWYIADIQTMDLARDYALDYGMDFYFGQGDPNFLVSSQSYMERNGMKWDADKYPVCMYNYFED